MQFDIDGNKVTTSRRFVESEAWKAYSSTGKMRWREFATAPKYGSVWEHAADIASTLLGTLGLTDAVTDNASVNIVPLQARWLWAKRGVGGLSGLRARLAKAACSAAWAAHRACRPCSCPPA